MPLDSLRYGFKLGTSIVTYCNPLAVALLTLSSPSLEIGVTAQEILLTLDSNVVGTLFNP